MLSTVTRIRLAVISVSVIASLALIRVLWWTDSRGSRRYVLFDDAMISLSYARTLVRGHGLVWFDGAPRVQGITNPGWTLLMAPFTALHSVRATSMAVSLLGMAVLAAIAWVIVGLTGGISGRAQLAVGFVVALHYPLVYWTIRGMEVGLITLVAVVAIGTAVRTGTRHEVVLAAVVAFGVVIRLDVVLVAFALAVVAFVLDGRRVSRSCVIPVLAGGASAVAVTIAQKIYYGSWVPNTVTLKMSGGPVGERLAAGFDSLVRHPYGVIFAVAAIAVSSPARRPLVWRLSAVALAYNAYSVFVGGDSWEQFANRYHALATPLAAVALVVALDGQWLARRGVVTVIGAWVALAEIRVLLPARAIPDRAALFAIVLVLLAFAAVAWRPRLEVWTALVIVVLGSSGWILDVGRHRAFDHEADVARVERAMVVRDTTSDDALIAVVSAGVNVYVADRPAVDLLGKSDERIASLPRRIDFFPGHDKWDLEISLRDPRPDMVLEETGPESPDVLLAEGYELVCTVDGQRFWVSDSTERVDLAAFGPC